MRKNLLLIFGIIFALILGVNSAKRISTLQNTSQKVADTEQRLEKLRQENEQLKRDLEYRKGDEFKEAEIRNKLGLVKEGEAVVIVPRDEKEEEVEEDNTPNWEKWRILFFGNS